MVTPQPTKAEILAKMNTAAEDAKKEFEEMDKLGELDDNTLKSLAGWWERWYLKTGHKRLGRILMSGGK